jgi:hypothetical protein
MIKTASSTKEIQQITNELNHYIWVTIVIHWAFVMQKDTCIDYLLLFQNLYEYYDMIGGILMNFQRVEHCH